MILSIYLFVFNTGENIYQPKLFVYIIFFLVDILSYRLYLVLKVAK